RRRRLERFRNSYCAADAPESPRNESFRFRRLGPRRLALPDAHHHRTVIALHGGNGLEVAVDRAQVVVRHTRKCLPRHWRIRDEAALTEASHELIFVQLSETAGLRVARDIRRRPRMCRIVGLREALRASEAWPGERASHLIALRVTRPAERN